MPSVQRSGRMLFSLLGLTERKRSKPLAQCAEGARGTLRLAGSDEVLPVTILQAHPTGVIVRVSREEAPGTHLVGNYMVEGVGFAFQGELQMAVLHRQGNWEWHIRYVLDTE
jgi:hypothetical protein